MNENIKTIKENVNRILESIDDSKVFSSPADVMYDAMGVSFTGMDANPSGDFSGKADLSSNAFVAFMYTDFEIDFEKVNGYGIFPNIWVFTVNYKNRGGGSNGNSFASGPDSIFLVGIPGGGFALKTEKAIVADSKGQENG